ncbi:uncharacterized protein A4U43_C08F21820 [Asparagus officinalis]|nr:uncharacterized protein A4U43_C08F21820 [Asparagus officinalis]
MRRRRIARAGKDEAEAKSQSGHFYDCIDIYKQPAFDNPLLKDHKLQMSPSSFPRGVTRELQPSTAKYNFYKNISCPLGTVQIRRTTKNDLIHAKTLQNHIKGHNSFQSKIASLNGSHFAVMKSVLGEYYGSHAALVVYGFPNITLNQLTMSEIWVIGGAEGPEDEVNVVQAGWDADGYKKACYNLECQGFVVVSRSASPGIEIFPLSTYGGIQELIDITIFKDQETGNWWLAFGDDFVGYWPKENFNKMEKATEVDWGGAVYSPLNEPSPPMGSGHLPFEGLNKTCYFLNVELVDKNNKYYSADKINVELGADAPSYYNIDENMETGYPDGYRFRYGGPGGYTG